VESLLDLLEISTSFNVHINAHYSKHAESLNSVLEQNQKSIFRRQGVKMNLSRTNPIVYFMLYKCIITGWRL